VRFLVAAGPARTQLVGARRVRPNGPARRPEARTLARRDRAPWCLVTRSCGYNVRDLARRSASRTGIRRGSHGRRTRASVPPSLPASLLTLGARVCPAAADAGIELAVYALLRVLVLLWESIVAQFRNKRLRKLMSEAVDFERSAVCALVLCSGATGSRVRAHRCAAGQSTPKRSTMWRGAAFGGTRPSPRTMTMRLLRSSSASCALCDWVAKRLDWLDSCRSF
jgi:hypothetical protein